MKPADKKLLYCCPSEEQVSLEYDVKLLRIIGFLTVLVDCPETAFKKLREGASQYEAIVLQPERFTVQEPEFFVREGWPGRWNQPRVMGYHFAWKLREHFPALPLVIRHQDNMIDTIDRLRKANATHSAAEIRLIDLNCGVSGLKMLLA